MGKMTSNGGGSSANSGSSSMLLEPMENIRSFATSRPPLVVFMACMGVIALILMTLAFYIKDAELKKPDGSQDWNVFLESFSDLEFCINNGTLPSSSMSSTVDSKESSTPTTEFMQTTMGSTMPRMDMYRNYSVSMLLAIQPTFDFVSIPHNLTTLNGFIYGSDLGLSGVAAGERIYMAMQLPFEWNSTICASASTVKPCSVVHIYTCVYFQSLDYVFPMTRHPQSCESLNDTGVEYHASILGRNPRHGGSGGSTGAASLLTQHQCHSRTRIKLHYKLDPTLTVLLSLSDRSVINLHLLHTSYFLFVMTITMLLYATIRGRRIKFKSPFSSVPVYSSCS